MIHSRIGKQKIIRLSYRFPLPPSPLSRGKALPMSKPWLLSLIAVALSVSDIQAQDRLLWGVSANVGYIKPISGFGTQFPGAMTFGLGAHLSLSSSFALEAEYLHKTKFDNGALEREIFLWSPAPNRIKEYVNKDINPAATHTGEIKSGALNLLYYPYSRKNMSFNGLAMYLITGLGYHKLQTTAVNIIWPGQSPIEARAAGGGVDAQGDVVPTVVMFPQEDKNTGWNFSIGLGFEFFLSPIIAIDCRIMHTRGSADLRAYDEWGLGPVSSFEVIRTNAGLKLYF